MIAEKIKFVDYDGNEQEETFYFNLNKAEVMEMEMSETGGLSKTLQRIVDTKDQKQLIKIFKEVILKAYGVKSVDGRRFIKSEALTEEFSQTEAYVELFMKLATDDAAATRFINGIMPKTENSVPAPSVN